MKNKSDIELIASIQKGSERAFEALYHRYERKVFYTAFSILRNEFDAKDAVQATFIQVHKSINTLRKPEFFLLWINRIVCGKCNDIFRKKKDIVIDIDQEYTKNYYIEEYTDFIPTQHFHHANDKELLDQFIDGLSYPQREVVVLCYFQHLSMQEIAEVLDVPTGTIKSRLYLAKKHLRQQIEAYQEKEGVALDFHNLDAMMIGYFAAGLTKLTAVSLGSSGLSIISKLKHFSTTSIGKMAVIAATITTTTVVSAGVYQGIQIKDQHALRSNVQNQKIAEITPTNAREAYFTLLHWAANEEKMKAHTMEEAVAIKGVYDYIKMDGGRYWDYLQEQKWNMNYEQLFQ